MASTAAALPAGAIVVRRWWLVAGALLCITAASLAGAAVWSVVQPAAVPNAPLKHPQGVVRATINLPPETATAGWSALSLSPDGKLLVYVGEKAGVTRLYLRHMDKLETDPPLPGTEGARAPFFKPDGQSVGFFAGGKLKTIRVDGSGLDELCAVQGSGGATWACDGTSTIYFADLDLMNGGLKSIRPGGEPKWLTDTKGDPSVAGHAYPCALPGGKSVLFTLADSVNTDLSLAVLTIETGQVERVLPHAFRAQYVSTGHILFRKYPDDGLVYAARFDLNRLPVVGPPVPVLKTGIKPAVSDTDCLVYLPGYAPGGTFPRNSARHLVWVNRLGGEPERWKSAPQSYSGIRLSPDGKRLAASVDARGTDSDILIYDIEGETAPVPLTLEGLNFYPVWTPDGKEVIFSSRRAGKPFNLFSAPANGSALPHSLYSSDMQQSQGSVHPDKPLLAFTQLSGAATGYDIYTLSLDGGGAAKPEPLIQTSFRDSFPQFSPDGDWLAYTSTDETGERDVWVQPYPLPAGGRRLKVSDLGGSRPRWSAQGNELFYRNDRGLYAVLIIETKPALRLGIPQFLFETPFFGDRVSSDYDVAADGRFVFIELTPEEVAAQGSVRQLIVVQNWFEELERLVSPQSAGGN